MQINFFHRDKKCKSNFFTEMICAFLKIYRDKICNLIFYGDKICKSYFSIFNISYFLVLKILKKIDRDKMCINKIKNYIFFKFNEN